MTIRDQSTLTGYFQGGPPRPQPTQTNFADLIDSVVLKEAGGVHGFTLGLEVDLGNAADQVAYTVPATNRAIVLGAVVRNPDLANAAVLDIKYLTNVLISGVALSGVATTEAKVALATLADFFSPIPAGGVINVDVTTTVASRTCRLDLLGYLLPATDPP